MNAPGQDVTGPTEPDGYQPTARDVRLLAKIGSDALGCAAGALDAEERQRAGFLYGYGLLAAHRLSGGTAYTITEAGRMAVADSRAQSFDTRPAEPARLPPHPAPGLAGAAVSAALLAADLPVVHYGPAAGTVTLGDGSVWSHRPDSRDWLAGADSGQRAPEPWRYRDRQGMTDADAQACVAVAILARAYFGTRG